MENDMQLTSDCPCSWSLLIISVWKAQHRFFFSFLFFSARAAPDGLPSPPVSSRLQPAAHKPLSLFIRCSSSELGDRLKQYFWCSCCLRLSSSIVECQHSGGWYSHRKDNPVQSQTACLFKSSSAKATLMHALCPTSVRVTFKVTLGAPTCTFNEISPMHYMDEFFLLAAQRDHVHASRCVFIRYLWTQARQYKSKKMGLAWVVQQK